jgi:hypothetical protein
MDTTMSDEPDSRAQQIAALEAALQLPLPEESRRQLLANLQALRAAPLIASPHAERDVNIATQQTVRQGSFEGHLTLQCWQTAILF